MCQKGFGVCASDVMSRNVKTAADFLFHSVVDAADSPRPPRLSKETCVCYLLKVSPEILSYLMHFSLQIVLSA